MIQLVNFWPDIALDDYINLKSRVESRMRISVMTSTGDDDYINQDESGDLIYRRKQLERLQNEVVDLEEMTTGISIMDLGLNEFRMDLLAYIKENPNLERTPSGIHAVVYGGGKPGVIFVLKNINRIGDVESHNRLHPFYIVYIGDDGVVIINHLEPKAILDMMRYLSRDGKEPDMEACHIFNQETNDGRRMERMSNLLQQAISSIITVKEESDLDSFFGAGQTTFLANNISGLDDFELLCFLVVLDDAQISKQS
ncbi:DEAD/DEAH box helicase-like protein [Gracilibacillus boraciitolerans JCM 21714]|uniref:DEAD/DEAH box helicase-like protein n=1 Tax=Gracilibacillus boraciitolerans JCM 21714 TaxID=1298598 RepID=W4VJT1_9BACI|nr:DEAD/DEAH box helicase-like protein [Gracilibacillus boraciitolerans JCM 21714]